MTSICKKKVVALTGFLLVLFIFVHLLGNLFIFAGPDAFNGYAEKLEHFGALTIAAEIILAAIFLIHIFATVSLILENIKARGANRYHVQGNKGRNLAARLMYMSGLYMLVFLVWHIFDFKFAQEHTMRSVVNGVDLDLYGIVFNSFKDPIHSVLYIVFVCFVGLHLSHGIESVVQTSGYYHPKKTPIIISCSRCLGMLVAAAFSSIPIYILLFK